MKAGAGGTGVRSGAAPFGKVKVMITVKFAVCACPRPLLPGNFTVNLTMTCTTGTALRPLSKLPSNPSQVENILCEIDWVDLVGELRAVPHSYES